MSRRPKRGVLIEKCLPNARARTCLPKEAIILTKLTRRAFVAGSITVAGAVSADSTVHALEAKPVQSAPLLIGYSMVNLWHTIDPRNLANLLADAGCTFTEIEYVAWFNQEARDGKSIETRIGAAKRFVNAMRKRRITTFISLINWNCEACRQQPDSWFLAQLREVQHEVGKERVILMGVSEPDDQADGKAYRWMRAVAAEWKGQRAANGDGGRGEPRVPGYDYVDWHHCDDFTDKTLQMKVAGKPAINNTDCGPVLNPGPERTRTMARLALERGAHFNVYGYRDDRIDTAVIAALGEEIRRGAAARRMPAVRR